MIAKRGRRWSATWAAGVALAWALSSAAPAGAHAFLIKSEPAAGATVRSAPRAVQLFFDEPVRAAPGIAVSRGGAGSVVAGRPYVPAGNPKEIVIPLRQGLGPGPYAVNWSEIDVEDGHVISGAFVFVVGSGLPPISASPAQGGNNPPLSAVLSRWLLLSGLLVAAGSFGFAVLVRKARQRGSALVLGAGLAVATLGALLSVVLEPDSSGTRFGRWMLVGAGVAGVGTACALASLRRPRLWLPAGVLAVVLLGLPTATGHASARGVPHAVSIPADLAHMAAAALWIGGALELARADSQSRRALVRRFAPFALAAVAVLGASGVVRAVNELAAVHQLWTTGYGRTLLVKTGVLVVVLAVALLSRRAIRTAVAGELVLFAVVVGAVAVLTNLRPGLAHSTVAAPAGAASERTVVLAGQDDDLAIGLALTPRGRNELGLRATVLGFTGPVAGLDLRFAVETGRTTRRAAATACRAGCYRATVALAGRPRLVSLRIAGRGRPAATVRFTAPAEWPAPDGTAVVRAAERAIGELHTLVVRSRLASDAHHEVTTVYKMVAPDRLSYRNDDGSASVIVDNRRWDRAPGARWITSPQFPPIRQPAPFWPPQVTNAHVLRTGRVDGRAVWVVSFQDPSTPTWFTAWVDKSSFRTLRLEMVAVAHFMHDRDGPFNAPIRVEPPTS